MITIIDCGLGNLSSIKNMFSYLGIASIVSSDKKEIQKASKLVLPGVGSFDTGMKNLKELDLISLIQEKVLMEKTPILGICLGAQLLLDRSDEGIEKGLALIGGNVISFSETLKKEKFNLPIPNMGWRDVEFKDEEDLKFKSIPSKFYFVHSFYFELEDKNYLWNTSNYGFKFCSGFKKDNVFGVQFHPEKSHQYGMQILKYFANYV
ncbi:imidazole glycerol phosphate synthase subunit HisH [Flavobacteriaceae bacterium]|jgi:glutamine amidotransferase|nr:imidazole glycerol phosphate synthase subunit HisH [Flavobacteriaceae bacterium]